MNEVRALIYGMIKAIWGGVVFFPAPARWDQILISIRLPDCVRNPAVGRAQPEAVE